jgi:xanthine dehydrogenase accessory factor
VRKERELWNFVADRLRRGEHVMLLVVAESSGSSPGRPGYKMAVGADGELAGSIGGGVMEVALVERARHNLSAIGRHGSLSQLVRQEHRKNSQHPSGMICSGEQTVISKLLVPKDVSTAETARDMSDLSLRIAPNEFCIEETEADAGLVSFVNVSDTDFIYSERLGPNNELMIIGGGHCALALSELMSKMDFRIHIFDDRPELNTMEKNEFADEITIVDSYDSIGDRLPGRGDVYVVVMTLGYRTDATVIRSLAGREFRYFGVLGSKAKMATLMREVKAEGYDADQLARIHTPIGIPINSHTPEEIAVSIAAEIISVKNG